MHRAQTSRLPKIFTSLLMLFALVFGSAIAINAPAQAASLTGCTNANAGSTAATSCSDSLSMGLDPAATSDVATRTHTSEDVSRVFLKWEGTEITSPACTITYSISETSAAPISWSFAINRVGAAASAHIQTAATGSTTAAIYTFTVSGAYACSNVTWTKTATFTYNLSGATLYTVGFQEVVGGVGAGAAGSFTSLTQASAGASVALPTNPSLTGYTFGGWSVTSGGTTPVSNTYTPTGNTTLYAIWTAVSGGSAPAATEPEPPSRKVTICHRTHAVTNPYVRITVDYNSVNKKSGHQGHDEIFAGQHVFTAGIYIRAKDKLWGDIIPADPSGLNRWQPLNWTPLGEKIYNGVVGGCPAYDPVAYYNAQREAGVPEKKLKQEMDDIEAELKEGNPGTSRVDPKTLKYTGNNAGVSEQENDKVTICHRTNSVTNPYVRITVSTSSVTNPAGHMEHDEIYNGYHVFDSTVTYPNNKKDWGDIIPADPTGKNRWQPLNWTTLGESIYNGKTAGCGEQTLQETYNKLRESGLSKKEIIDELEKMKNVDEDPKDIDELTYKGNDPEVKKNEPNVPQEPTTTPPAQSLSGIIWLDRNKDGMKDPDEPLMPNIEVTLHKDGSPVGTVKTDPNGFYQFTNLNPGDYKVTTKIPDDLDVTYDSEGLNQGEMNATVPTGGHAFTWAALVGKTILVDEKLMETILKENPKAIPASEIPAWLKAKIAGKSTAYVAPVKKPVTKSELAATGSNQFMWLLFGLFLMLAGTGISVTNRKRN